MVIQKSRYFLVNGTKKKRESIEWLLCGTKRGSVGMMDERGVAIGEIVTHPETQQPVDKWFPMSVSNPGFDPSLVASMDYGTRVITDLDPYSPTYGKEKVISVPIKTNAVVTDLYSIPLKSGWVEITKEQYEA